MSKLYILGNGFDLAHKLPTKYSDFRCWLCKNDNDEPSLKHILDELYPLSENWSNFEEALANPNLVALKQFTDLDLDTILVKDIRKKFYAWAYSIKKSNEFQNASKKFQFSNNDFFLSFNYTPTLEVIYGIESNKILHIHGYDIEHYFDETSSLVFGHGEATKNNEIEAVRLTYKNCEVVYASNALFFQKVCALVQEIEVIGFSYSPIDFYYFKKIQDLAKEIKWIFNVHSDTDRKNLGLYIEKLNLKEYKIKGEE